MKYDLGNIGNI